MKSFLSLSFIVLTAGTYCSSHQLNEKCENYKKEFQSSPPTSKGVEAQLGQLPHSAALIYLNEKTKSHGTYCAGSLISKKHVIAPAHCINPLQVTLKFVRLGVVSIPEEITTQDPIVDHNIKNITVHPEYSRQLGTAPNDIAIIELEKEITFSDTIRPACLNTKEDRSDVIFSYWGKKDENSNTLDLRTATSTPVSNEACNNAYKKIRKINITEKQTCVKRGNEVACTRIPEVGLQAPDGKLYVLVSIPSFGPVCSDVPDVNTRISKYLDWIEQTVFVNN